MKSYPHHTTTIQSAPVALTALLLTTLLALTNPSLQAADSAATKADHGLLLVANKGDRTLSIVDPVTGTETAVVQEDGVTGHELVASADGKEALIPIYGNSGVGKAGTDGQLVRMIDLKKHEIVGTVDFGHGVRPHCAVIGPKSGLLYVSTELENTITIIDSRQRKILGTLPTGQTESHMFTITSDETKAYTANVGPGTVSVIDIKNRKTTKIIPISKVTQRISISPDDHWVFTADQTKPQMAVIDTTKDEVSQWIELPAVAYGTAPTPDGRWLVAALSGANQVAIIDLKTMKVASTVAVPKSPQEVVVRPDGLVAYVSCDASAQVAVIDLKKSEVEKLIKVGKGADGLAWAVSK